MKTCENKEITFGKNKKIKKLKKFLFPYYPLRLFKSVPLLAFLSFLFAIHIILVYIGFNIPIINLQIGFDWIPTYLAGWFFGPIIGSIFGFIANNIYWLQTGGTFWFWMYSIQEPVIAVFASLVSFYFYYALQQKNIIRDIIIQQFSFIIFFLLSLLIIILAWINQINFDGIKIIHSDQARDLLISALVIFGFFFIFCECFIIYKLKKKINSIHFNLFLSATVIVTSMIFLFGIALGPFTTINFLYAFHFINNNLITGELFLSSAIAQVILQCIRVPLAILILYGVLRVSQKPFLDMINSVYYKKQV